LAHLISFDTPPSSTDYDVLTTGTVAGWSTAHVMVTLNVLNTSTTHPRDESFYREKNFPNTGTSGILAVTETLRIAITPMLHGTDTVQTVVAFGY